MESEIRMLVVVPCCNEADRLPVESFLNTASSLDNCLDFLFVNDGSQDQTSSVILEMQKHQPGRIELLNLDKNQGKAEAVRQGILLGLQSGKYSYLGFLDADLSSPREEIRFLIDYSGFLGGGHEFIFGSRMKHLGSDIQRKTLRHYFGRIAATAASVSLSLPVYDTQCGVKLFSSDICNALFAKPFLSRWLFDVEIFFRAKALYSREEFDQKVLEVPLRTWKETPGTKLKSTDIFMCLWNSGKSTVNIPN